MGYNTNFEKYYNEIQVQGGLTNFAVKDNDILCSCEELDASCTGCIFLNSDDSCSNKKLEWLEKRNYQFNKQELLFLRMVKDTPNAQIKVNYIDDERFVSYKQYHDPTVRINFDNVTFNSLPLDEWIKVKDLV